VGFGAAGGVVAGGAQPQRRLGRLHGLVHDGEQLGGQSLEVDLLAQAGAEGGDGHGRVVAAAVEATVDHLLDAAAGRLEHRGERQGRPGHQAGVLAEELAEAEDHDGVAPAEQHGQRAVGQRAADDAGPGPWSSAPARHPRPVTKLRRSSGADQCRRFP